MRFGPFELDARAGELRKHGIKIKLREQPVRILVMLVEQPGEVVLREEIRLRLWPNNTIVEFDHGINAAIQKLRDALGESADNPRYVETVARRGYRFLGEVERVGEDEKAGEPQPAEPPPDLDQSGLEGTTVSHYRILEKLGEGGMGVVWRAHDPRLNRDVAIKISQMRFSDRFEREARAIAALNHPNICTLYDVGPNYLVMELIEGQSPKGPLPLEEALRIARQIADALDAAHEKGIVHRDLKPANIKIKPDGVVKVLDFGLAKTIEMASGDPESSPTETVSPTRAGMILGTAAYMSPEQARGKSVDKRADIWAFGVVLYEMLTGRRPFHGNDLSEVLASVMKDMPDLSTVPARVRPLLESCLEKDPKKRLRDIGDVWRWIESRPGTTPPTRSARRWLWPGVAALLAVCLAALAIVGSLRRSPVGSERAMTFTILPPAGVTLDPVGGGMSAPELSPDGSAILYSAANRAYVRRLDSLESQVVPGVDRRNDPMFWSPDSKAVVLGNLESPIVRVRLPDGAPQAIASPAAPTRGGSWSDAGTMLIGSGTGSLWVVPASGGELKPMEMPARFKEGDSRYPQFLPGGEDFLFEFDPDQDPDDAGVYLATLRDGKAVDPVLLFENQTAARYTPAGDGRILFVRNDNLYSQKLNRHARKLEGEAELVTRGVASQPGIKVNRADFSVARNGTVAWRPGRAALSQATEFDRTGKLIGTTGPFGSYGRAILSPDEKQLLLPGADDWLADVGKPGRLQLPRGIRCFGWSADGSKLIGVGGGSSGDTLVEMSASGLGEVHELCKTANFTRGLPSISADGMHVIGTAGPQLLSIQLGGTAEEMKPRVLSEKGDTRRPTFSPDGRWFVYNGTDAGIYVQPFPGPGARRQIAQSGSAPIWRGDGREIIYVSRLAVMSVSVERVGNDVRFGEPHELFHGFRPLPGRNASSRPLAISRDGSRIFWLQGVEQPDSNMIYIKTGAVR